MNIIILAGGYATRLLPLTEHTPKHLLPVKNIPMINYLMAKLAKLDVEHMYLVTNNKFTPQFEIWAQNSPWKEKLTIVNDGTTSNEDRLGSLGDILYVIDQFNIKDDLLIAGADNITELDFDKMLLQFNEKKSPVIGAYDIKNMDLVSQFGQVAVDDEGKLTSFIEKPKTPTSTLIAMLFYCLPQSAIETIRHCCKEGKHDKAGWLIEALMKKQDVYAIVDDGYWFDIGTPETYKEAQDFFEREQP